jgi:hypothetical protein
MYVGATQVPMFMYNDARDFFFPLDSHSKTYALVQSPKKINIDVGGVHGVSPDAHVQSIWKKGAKREATDLINAKLQNSALISTISASNAVLPLCPKFLVREALVVGDPLLEFAAPKHEASRVEQQALGIANDNSIDLNRLKNRLQYYSALAPYIEAGFLHTLPLGLLHEAPQDIPVNAPRNRNRELVPADAVEFVRQAAIVRPMEKTAGGLIVLDEPNTRLKRHVNITFDGDEAANSSSFYSFRKMTFEHQNADGSIAVSWPAWSDEPLDKAQYDISGSATFVMGN